jgi:hypothetical protein
LWPVVVWLLVAVLQWLEPEAEGGGASATPSIILSAFSPDLDRSVLDLALPGHHGGGKGGANLDGLVLCRSAEWRWRWFFFFWRFTARGLLASAIHGRHGGLESTTSDLEALLLPSCWSSAFCCCQVVRPRQLQGVQQRRILAGLGRSGICALFLGGNAWGTPATRGGDIQGLDCFSIFSPRVFSVRWLALSSNIWFFRASDVKGLACNSVPTTCDY